MGFKKKQKGREINGHNKAYTEINKKKYKNKVEQYRDEK